MKITFNEFFSGVSGLSAGEKREAKSLLRHAFKAGRDGKGLANAMTDNDQWQVLARPSQDALRAYIVQAYVAGEQL